MTAQFEAASLRNKEAMARILPLYLVIGPENCPPGAWLEVARSALEGGVTCLQYRDKTSDDPSFLENARALVAVAKPFGVPVLINDRLHLVGPSGAQGAHIGQDDSSPQAARDCLGDAAILGLSVGSLNELEKHDPALVDYLGVGPAFSTSTKADSGEAIGPDGISTILACSATPAVAIGGITTDSIPYLYGLGLYGVALITFITKNPDPKRASLDIAAKVKMLTR